MSEFADKLQAEPLKFVLLDQLIQIDVQELKNDAHVIAKHKIVKPVNKQHGSALDESAADKKRNRELTCE